MNRGKVILVIFCLILVCSLSYFVFYFINTGGVGLFRIVTNYLIPNIPNKEYSWKDFTDRGVDKEISGFYSSGDANSFKIWTLSGLKTFYHKPLVSLYVFHDTCAVYNNLKNADVKTAPVEQTITPGLFTWEKIMKKEYFVTVSRLGKEFGNDFVHEARSQSGKYTVLGQIEEGVCD